MVGASNDGGEEEAGLEEETASATKKSNTYNIYGTVKNQEEFKKPEHIKEIIKVN